MACLPKSASSQHGLLGNPLVQWCSIWFSQLLSKPRFSAGFAHEFPMFFPFKYPFSEGYQTPHTKHDQLSGPVQRQKKQLTSLLELNPSDEWTHTNIYISVLEVFLKSLCPKNHPNFHGLFHFSIQAGNPPSWHMSKCHGQPSGYDSLTVRHWIGLIKGKSTGNHGFYHQI